MDKFTSYCHLF